MEGRFQTFTVLMAKISRSILRIKKEEMAEYELKSVHVSCLYYLYNAPDGLTAKELCEVCDEDKAAVSRSLELLEERGLVVCDSDTKKRYKNPFTLTKEGERTSKGVAEKIDGILEKASVGLSEDERRIMYSSLSLISENLQKICNTYGDRK